MSHRTRTSPVITPAARWSDAQLLQAVDEGGSQHCFEILVSRYAPLVLGVCRRSLHDEHEAEDAAQAVFLILWKKAGAIAHRKSAAGWLHRVARYVCRNVCRARLVREKHEREAVAMKSPSEEGAEPQVALRETLDDELDRLPEKYRVPLILFHFQGKTLSEIAELTNTNLSTLGTRLGRGRELLARRLSRRGVAVTGTMLATALSSEAASAAVSGAFVPAATEAAVLFSAGGSGGPLSATASATASEVMKSMLLVQVKLPAAVGVVCAVLLGGGLALQSRHERQQAPVEEPAVRVVDRVVESAPIHDAVRQRGAFAGLAEAIAAVVPPSMALSDDGKLLVLGEEMPHGAGYLRCWDTGSGELIHERFEPFGVVCVAVSDNGRQLAYARGDHTMQVVSTEDFVDQVPLQGHAQKVRALAFSPDSQQLASAGSDWTIRMWDVESGRRLAMVKTASQLARAVAFADRGNRIVSYSQSLETWNWNGAAISQDRKVDLDRPANRPALTDGGSQMLAILADHARAAVVDTRSGKEATRLAFEPEGNELFSSLAAAAAAPVAAAGTTEGDVILWDTHDGKVTAKLPVADGPISALAMDAGGRLLTTVTWQGQVSLWDIQTQKLLRTLEQPVLSESAASQIAVAVSPGGQFSALRRRAAQVEVYDTLTGRRIARQSASDDDASAFAVSSDGKRLICGSADGRLLVHDLASGEVVNSIPIGDTGITATAVADSRPIAVAADEEGFVCHVQLDEARVLQRQKLHEGAVQHLIIAPDSSLVVTAGADGVVRAHEFDSLQRSQRIGRHEHPVTALAASISGDLLASADASGTVRIWTPSADSGWTTEEIALERWLGPPLLKLHQLRSLAISPRESMLIIGTELLPRASGIKTSEGDGNSAADNQSHEAIRPFGSFLIHYDLDRRRAEVNRTLHPGICALAFRDNDLSLLLGTTDGALYRRRGSLKPVQVLDGHEGGTRFVAYLPDGKRLISGGADETIRLWSTADGKLLKSAPSEHGVIVCGALSPDGRTLVTGGYGSGVYFWDAHTLQRSGAKFHHKGRIGGLSFSRDGKWLASASWDKTVKIWDVRTRRVVRTLDPFSMSAGAVQFSEDGTLLAAAAGNWTEWFSDGEIRVWDRATGRVRFQDSQLVGSARSVSFSPDGDRVLACTSAMSVTWDLDRQSAVDVRRRRRGVNRFALLTNGQNLIECVDRNILQISDVESGQVRVKFRIPAARFTDLSVAPDQQRFATATSSPQIFIWELEPQPEK